MNYAAAVTRLWNHSNLPRSEASPEESLLFLLYHASRSQVPPRMEELIDDVLQCLTIVNLQMNGPTPSETSQRASSAVLQEIAYPVSGIISGCLRYHRRWERESLFSARERQVLYEGVVRIAYAWDQVLAGDVDDIVEGFESE